jgi:hypothetical protein
MNTAETRPRSADLCGSAVGAFWGQNRWSALSGEAEGEKGGVEAQRLIGCDVSCHLVGSIDSAHDQETTRDLVERVRAADKHDVSDTTTARRH